MSVRWTCSGHDRVCWESKSSPVPLLPPSWLASPCSTCSDADLQAAVGDPDSNAWAELNALSRAEVSQATGMLVAQLEIEPAEALVRLRAHAYSTGRSATGQPVSVVNLNAAAARWPRFVPAALDAGFASVHAVPMRAAGIVLGALGLFGTDPGELDDADRLVAQTLAHIACVAILQEHAPTPSTVMPQLRSALASRVIVEQAKGLLRETLNVSVEDAFTLMRSYARANGEHLTDVARRLMTDRHTRPALVGALAEFATAPPH